MNTTVKLDFRKSNPRRNLPCNSAGKRGESNFVGAFERAYLSQHKGLHIGGREFELPGFGIADLVLINCRYNVHRIDKLLGELQNEQLLAFEMKLRDWRKALQQAYKYSYFADQAFVVIPMDTAKQALSSLKLFQILEIGLWTFDTETNSITKIYTPSSKRARNDAARTRAFALVFQKLNLRKLQK